MQLNSTQLGQVDAQIKRLIKTDSYYGKMYREMGITGVSSNEDFQKIPFSSKADLRNAYPLGIQAVPDEEVVRIRDSRYNKEGSYSYNSGLWSLDCGYWFPGRV